MNFHELDALVLDRDLPEHDLRRGDLGAVVHVYDDSTLDVEFVRVSGYTQALVRVNPSDLRRLAEDDLPAVRSLSRHGSE